MENGNVSLFGTSALGGEAAPNQFGFRGGDGSIGEGARAIFPIIRQCSDGTIDLLGTGFFISQNGIFVSARHVLDAAFDHVSGKQSFPVAMIHLYEGNSYFIRPILRYARHPSADIAAGAVAPMKRNSDGAFLSNKSIALNTNPVGCDSNIVTFAYPRCESRSTQDGQIFNVMPDFYDGKIIEYLPAGRDRVMLPGPCYRTNMKIHHGASGGPVFSRDGMAFALNSTGFDGTEDSYISSLDGLLDLCIDDVAMENQAPRSVSIREMARAGHVTVKPIPQ